MSVDALEDWLSSPIINTSQDPIAYWAGMQAAGHPLATMALDFLSIPGEYISCIVQCMSKLIQYILATSTDVERSFSRGGLTISKLRHSLSDESARAATVLGSWSRLEGAIPKDVILQRFKDKSKHPNKRQKVVVIAVDTDGSGSDGII